jgi:toxin YoeB
VKVTFATDAWEQYLYWQNAHRKSLKRINLLIRDIVRGDPGGGMGKPERLRGDLSGFSSRRIDDVHRLVYRVDADADSLLIAQCRYHYSDR